MCKFKFNPYNIITIFALLLISACGGNSGSSPVASSPDTAAIQGDLLLKAVQANDPKGVVDAIAAGADLNVRDSAGNTPLILAVQKDELLSVSALTKAHCNLALINKDGKNAYDVAFDKTSSHQDELA